MASSQPDNCQSRLRVVVLEPDPVIASFYTESLRVSLRDTEVTAIDFDDPRLGEVLPHADVCVCSTSADPHTQFHALLRLLLIRPELPVIILLPANCAVALETVLRLGAADVLIRTSGYLDQLPLTVRKVALQDRGLGHADARYRALRTALDGIEAENRTLQSLIERLQSLAMTDPLTGVLNRRAFDAALARSVATARRHNHDLACLALDVDCFKGVNDALGHALGDELLRLLASIIIAECRQSDIAARIGGDEFVVLLPFTAAPAASLVAQRLRRRFDREAEALCRAHGYTGSIGLSIGVSSRGGLEGESPTALLAAADAALYQVKRAGRDAVQIAVRPDAGAHLKQAG